MTSFYKFAGYSLIAVGGVVVTHQAWWAIYRLKINSVKQRKARGYPKILFDDLRVNYAYGMNEALIWSLFCLPVGLFKIWQLEMGSVRLIDLESSDDEKN